MTELTALLTAMAGLGWLILVVILLYIYRSQAKAFFDAAVALANRSTEIKFGSITIGQAVGQLQAPSSDESLTDDHVALIHRSWRVPKRDAEFGGREMYQIHVIVFGTSAALQRVDYVIYRLEKAYKDPVRMGGQLNTNFELKELANGYSLLRAEVYVRGQPQPVRLSRLIDLTEQSPPLKGSYQKMAAKAS